MPHTPDHFDVDQPNPRLIAELVARYEASASRLRNRVISPPGKRAGAQQWNQARAAQILAQVEQEIGRLKQEAAAWAGPALERSMSHGIAVADRQAKQAGVINEGSPLRGTFSIIDRDAAEVLARDTVSDLFKAADSMRGQAGHVLHRMAATGVTNAQVNEILTGGVIEGQPVQAIRELREALRKVHGGKVTITDKNGQPMEFAVGYYARMVAVTKTREATSKARHARLKDRGIDLVVVVGRVSNNFCTAYLDKVFSISGDHPQYPPLSSLPGGGPPFHPNCSKSTAPFIEALADPQEIEAGEPDPDTDKLLNVRDRSDLQRRFQALQGRQQAEARRQSLRTDAGRRVHTSGTDDVGYQASVIRDLGVESVRLAGDPAVGAQVVRGLQQAAAAGGTMPREVVVDAFLFQRPGEIGAFDYATGRMALNPDWPGWRDGGKTINAQFEDGFLSSSHPLHAIYHEAAHAHAATVGADHGKAKHADPRELVIARSVSRRAAKDRDEFLAEVRAAKMAGRRFKQDVLNLYERLGGR